MQRRESRFPGGVEGGVTSVTMGEGDKFHPGENKKGEGGVYKSNKFTREKAQDWGCGEINLGLFVTNALGTTL